MIILNQNEIESKINSGELSKDFYVYTAELKNRFSRRMKEYRWLVLKDNGEALYLLATSKIALIRKLQKIDKNVGELIEKVESIKTLEKIEEDFQKLEKKAKEIKGKQKSNKLDEVLMNIVLILFFLLFSRLVFINNDKVATILLISSLFIILAKELINLFKRWDK